MRKPVAALVCLLLLVACSGDRPKSKAAYTEEFAARLRQAAPTLKVEIKAELELTIATPPGNPSTAYLDNGYKEYLADPKQSEEVYKRYIDAFIESGKALATAAPLDKTLITPIIKDRAWITEVIASTRALATKDKPVEFVYESLNSELLIVYAEDSPKTLSYLTPAKLKTTGLKTEELRKLAVQNLKRMLTTVEAKGGNGIYMMTAGGTYEASLLLFDDIWQEKRLQVEGEYVVAVPSRDMLLITGSGNKDALKKIRDLAKRTVAEAPYHLTADLFVYRDGRFVRFEE